MGGSAGRADALTGALESQKAEGAFLHIHALLYLQSAHQFSTLQELADKLKSGMLSAEAFKEYVSYVRCAQCPDLENFKEMRLQIEMEWPQFN